MFASIKYDGKLQIHSVYINIADTIYYLLKNNV